MTSNILLSLLTILELLIGSYFLGKYISKSNEIFDNNPFASWTLGFITNFFVTFLAFFPLTWLDTPIIYYTIVFFTKEFFTYTFLVMKRERFIHDINIKNIAIILLAAIAIVFVYNYGIVEYTKDVVGQKISDFNSWFKFKEVVGHFSKLSDIIINKWLLSFISASVIFSIIASFVVEISRGNNIYDIIFSFILTLVILCVVGVGIRIEDAVGYFLLLFMMLIAIRLIIFSRRRYAAQFGITSFVAWTIDSHIFIAATTLAFITTIIYTFLKKPKASLFWVQLISPQIIMMTLELHLVSNAVVIPLFILSAGMYIFMLSVSRLKLLERLNKFVIKNRILIPIIMFLIVIIASIITIVLKDIPTGWMGMKTTSSVIYNNSIHSKTSSIIQMVLWWPIILYVAFNIFRSYKMNKNFRWKEFITIFVVLLTIFVYNPFTERMFESTSALKDQISYMGIIASTPLIILYLNMGNKRLQSMLRK